ncbi:hypothetical protein [Citrobacter portucalensis]|uniref:hypothetical protein n=1 Tax=Citrobacter portucalensis TaxID=1639133 RepID=UPI00292B0603|nr:hypothetical protein [Citrobacter portucalensis]MDV0583375.1 hypothetical protein [Citrobacter portucalensis]MEB0660188.1 hypothetical protein [Citrobacter portucalensis]MEB0700165.1 hypothetical protein [Citrobacter portucalensis]
MSQYDSKALEFSREVIQLMYGPMPVGGSVQLLAKVQCLFIEAMEYAQPATILQVAEPVSQPYKLREWTNEQCLEFLTVAFRHNEISGDIEFDDIRLGVKFALAAAPQQEVKSALEHGMQRYAGAMQKLSEGDD